MFSPWNPIMVEVILTGNQKDLDWFCLGIFSESLALVR